MKLVVYASVIYILLISGCSHASRNLARHPASYGASACAGVFEKQDEFLEKTSEVPLDVLIEMKKNAFDRDHALVSRFKNEGPETRSPKVVDLTGGAQIPAYLELSRFTALGEGDQETRSKRNAMLDAYYMKVAALQKGDTLVFEFVDEVDQLHRRSFRLGKFLGSGNSVHIFELADMPGRAIRVPYTQPIPRLRWDFGTTVYSQNAPRIPGIRRIEIYEVDNAFAVVELIHGSESSSDYIKQLQAGQYGRPLYQDTVGALRDAGLASEAKKLEGLIFVLQKSGALSSIGGKSILGYTRQFTYDEGKQEWVLTDWE